MELANPQAQALVTALALPDSQPGLSVVFSRVETIEVRVQEASTWKKLAPLALAGTLLVSSIAAWGRHGALGLDRRACALLAATSAAAVLGLIRHVGVKWRFDHRQKLVTRQHWLRGCSKRWKAKDIFGLRTFEVKDWLGDVQVQLAIVDHQGRPVAEMGRWEKGHVDLTHVYRVVQAIKQVMWWK